MNFSEKNIKTIVSFIKGFYLFITITLIILVIILYFLAGGFRIEALIGILISGAIYMGLKNKQPWVVSVIIFLASIGIISQLLYSPDSIVKLSAKIFGIALTIFEIYFFTRKEVKRYFRVKSVFLFGR